MKGCVRQSLLHRLDRFPGTSLERVAQSFANNAVDRERDHGNPFSVPDDETLFAWANKEIQARRDFQAMQRKLPLHEKRTQSYLMQSCNALSPGELNPRRYVRKQPSG